MSFGERGTIYLLHFDRPLAHARHYLGWTQDLNQRLEDHMRGRGARLVAVIVSLGIGFTLARTWENKTRHTERKLKQHGKARICPVCQGEKR